jgi:hypothetical protein
MPERRQPAPEAGTITVVIEGSELPGRSCHPADGEPHDQVHVALCGRAPGREALTMPGLPVDAIEPVAGNATSARWTATVTVRRGAEGFDFTGPFVRGDRRDRNIGLAWGDVPGDGTLRMFRRAKLRLADVDPDLIEQALRPDHRLVARVRLTDAAGNPICARIRPPDVRWQIS